MMRKNILLLSITTVFLLASGGRAFALKAYITDPKEVGVRSGASSQKRVVTNLAPGTPVELLTPNQWSHIRYTGQDGESKEGWVPSRSVGLTPPDSILSQGLQRESDAQKEQIAALEKEKADLQQKVKELSDRHGKLETNYEALKSGSANYVKLKDQFDSTRAELDSATENVKSLTQENENLKLTEQIKWFAAGGFVLLVGLLLGWLTGRQQKKRRASYRL